MTERALFVIACPDLAHYKEQPKDQSFCRAVDCPECNQKMWLSVKKLAIIKERQKKGEALFVACYECIKKTVLKNPDFFANSEVKNI